MTCVDCGQAVTESERRGVRFCFFCKAPMHGECAMVVRSGDDACEKCYGDEGARYTLIMSFGAGEGRDPLPDEVGYSVKLPVVEDDSLMPWYASLDALDAEDSEGGE